MGGTIHHTQLLPQWTGGIFAFVCVCVYGVCVAAYI